MRVVAMKKFLFCILVLGSSAAFGMDQAIRAHALGDRTLQELDPYIKRERERDDFYEQKLAHLESQMGKFEGDAKSYLEMVRFVIQTQPEHACDADQSGQTPVQKLDAWPVPDPLAQNPAVRTAMLKLKWDTPKKWVFCQYWFGKTSLRAQEERLRGELMRDCEEPCSRRSGIVNCARDLGNAGNLEKFRSCEGYDFFKKIEDMKKWRQICDTEYRQLWICAPTAGYLKAKKADSAIEYGKRLVEGECAGNLNYLQNLQRCFAGYPGEVHDDVQKELYYWNTNINQLKGGKKAFMELIFWAVQESYNPWQRDETGLNALQRLMAYPMPADDREACDAMRDTKKAVIDIWMKRPRAGQAPAGKKELRAEREEKEDNGKNQELNYKRNGYQEVSHQEHGVQAGVQAGDQDNPEVDVDAAWAAFLAQNS
jgi:hypothetical protein